jgi:hypothetical protein
VGTGYRYGVGIGCGECVWNLCIQKCESGGGSSHLLPGKSVVDMRSIFREMSKIRQAEINNSRGVSVISVVRWPLDLRRAWRKSRFWKRRQVYGCEYNQDLPNIKN